MEADPVTQTYLATFVMPAPRDVAILPGMTTTINEHLKEGVEIDTSDYLLPIEAVAVDGLGNYYVWMVQQNADGTYECLPDDNQGGEAGAGDNEAGAAGQGGDAREPGDAVHGRADTGPRPNAMR